MGGRTQILAPAQEVKWLRLVTLALFVLWTGLQEVSTAENQPYPLLLYRQTREYSSPAGTFVDASAPVASDRDSLAEWENLNANDPVYMINHLYPLLAPCDTSTCQVIHYK